MNECKTQGIHIDKKTVKIIELIIKFFDNKKDKHSKTML